MNPDTRQDRRRADRAAQRMADGRGRTGQARRPSGRAERPAQTPRPATSRRGGSFLNTLIIVLLVVLAVMLLAAFLVFRGALLG